MNVAARYAISLLGSLIDVWLKGRLSPFTHSGIVSPTPISGRLHRLKGLAVTMGWVLLFPGLAFAQLLPQDHQYQVDLYNWLQTISVQDVTVSHTDLVWDGSYTDTEQLSDMWLDLSSGASRIPTFAVRGDAKWFVLDNGGAGIEGTGVVRAPRWAADAAFWYYRHIPLASGGEGNPYYNDPAMGRRALISAAVDMMMLDHDHDQGNNDRSDYLGGSLNTWMYAYWRCKHLLTPSVQAAFEAGFSRMLDKFLLWRPRQVNTNMDTRAISASAYVYLTTNDAALQNKALRVVRRFLFGYETGTINDLDDSRAIFMLAGYVSEARGPETTYNGVSFYHILEAYALTHTLPDWSFLAEVVQRMMDFKLYQVFKDPGRFPNQNTPNFDGPSGYASRTGGPALYDQQGRAWRDIVAADLHPTEKSLARALRATSASFTIPPTVADLVERTGWYRDYFNGTGAIGTSDTSTPPVWQENHWPENHPFLPPDGWWNRLNGLLSANDPSTLTPFERPGDFNRLFGDEFWAYKANDGSQDFGFFAEHAPSKWPYDSFAGGSLQTFWTEEAGMVVLSKHNKAGDTPSKKEDTRVFSVIDTWGAHHVWGHDNQGYAFTSAAWNDIAAGKVNLAHVNDAQPYVEYRTGFADERGWPTGVVDPPGVGIDTTKALLVSRFTAVSDGVEVRRTFTSDGSIQVTSLWETIPIFLRDCNPATSQGKQCSLPDATIDYWDGGSWRAMGTGTVTTSKLRVSRDYQNGSGPAYTYIKFAQAESVKLSANAWQGIDMTDNRLRNIHVDLLGTGGSATAMPAVASVTYTIGTTDGASSPPPPPPPPSNQPPTATLATPANGASYPAPATVNMEAYVGDPDGNVVLVEFFRGSTKLGQDTNGSNGWTYTWSNVAAGNYTLTVKATDNSGATTTSNASGITVSGSSPPPSQATIALNPNTTYQTMTGWEGAAQLGQLECPSFNTYKNELLDRIAFELGINRLRLEIGSGTESPTDYFTQFINGQIPFRDWARNRYNAINDNGNPNSRNNGGFHFASLDHQINSVYLPLRQRLASMGETLFLNLTYVHFNPNNAFHANDPDEYAEFVLAVYDHMQSTFGFVPDTWEVILEPDGVIPWDGTKIGQAMAAAASRLQAAGYTPRFVAPSTSGMGGIFRNYVDAMAAVPGAMQHLKEIAYHRYRGAEPSDVMLNLQEIVQRTQQHGVQAAMLEHIGSGYEDLHQDLSVANVTAWQQFSLAFCDLGNPDTGSRYYNVDTTNVSNPVVRIQRKAKFLRQYYRWVRSGAVRIGATSASNTFEPLGFVNTDGGYVVVVKANGGGTFTVGGLPAGTYGVRYTTNGSFDVDAGDVSISSGGLVQKNIPAAGVITIYNKSGGGTPPPPPPNQAPTVSLIAPSNGATFPAPANVAMQANASDSDGNVVRVEFFRGNTKLGQDTNGGNGWTYTWSNVAAGSYTLTAKAFDNDGASTTSGTVNITVQQGGPPPPPPSSQQAVSLTSGWNLVSSYIAPANPTMSVVLADILSEVVEVRDAHGGVFNPNGGINTINTWDPEEAYLINVRSAVTLTVSGTQVVPNNNPIALAAGGTTCQAWNVVSYLRASTMPVDQAMASISNQLVMVKDEDGQIYCPQYGINDIGDLLPGRGYQICVSQAATLTYPANGQGRSLGAAGAEALSTTPTTSPRSRPLRELDNK